jgi:hypothetical protein
MKADQLCTSNLMLRRICETQKFVHPRNFRC